MQTVSSNEIAGSCQDQMVFCATNGCDVEFPSRFRSIFLRDFKIVFYRSQTD
jgi:hypothetical protein